jgi:S-DNA-T family DNA segregation ATPase FtsK/SpoIIIE
LAPDAGEALARMNDRPLSERQREAARLLAALVKDRAEAEVRIKATFEGASAAIEGEFTTGREAIERKFVAARRATDKDFRARAQQMKQTFEEELASLELEYESSLARMNEKAEVNETATRKALQEAIWLTETVFEATESQPREQFDQTCKGIDGKLLDLQTIEEKAATLLKKYRQRDVASHLGNESSPNVPLDAAREPATSQEGFALLDTALDRAKAALDRLQAMFAPKLFQGFWPLLFIIVVSGVAVFIGQLVRGWGTQGVLLDVGLGVVAAVALLALLHVVARSRIAHLVSTLRQQAGEGRAIAQQCRIIAERHRDRHQQELIEKRDIDLRLAREKYEPILAEIKQRRDYHIERIHERFPREIQEHKETFERDKKTVDDEYRMRMAFLQKQHDQDQRELKDRYAAQMQQTRTQYETDWNALEERWNSGMRRVYADLDVVNAEAARLFPPWNDRVWNGWQPPMDFAPIIRFGQLRVNLNEMPGGIPKDERLIVPGPPDFTIPAMLAFPDLCSLLIQTSGSGRDEAVAVLQTVMFRLLSTLPPGKVRFTIIDPVGLGQNFAGFMHLADYDGAYVTDKIWTEDRHIEQRLLDLTEHMENVIQKYLRNEYETIGAYNEDAGEIAEPFRFLVIANFPVNFSESAARRLASVINSGARCGVYTLITVDSRQPMPPGIQMQDLERNSVKLVHEKDHLVLKDEDYAPFPLTVDQPPSEDFLTEKLHLIGEAAKDSSRVEVPFDVIAPEPDEIWSGDTTNDISVALGRAGATKLQHLTLGVGTSQHALVAGKTGSGKSTLLHALITNLALWYSPDEVEFYLVDFKKGVEFKTYATHELPHARAVAIESDREFGLSVLQRLDAELKHRGNLYRDLGVQDLAGYRRSGHPEMLPRTLLIIDEFQELFIEDDKIAQDAALLLDRLVRQGRAFGMHVLLGSQTLGGAYTLARSTIGQMGVRIALQCSEADSYLILSDDNAAARLLSRPGEAIYNDASGMVEGNNPFQIVWLPDDKREQCLRRVRETASKRNFKRREPQIVFEGNVPAEIARNHLLEDLLRQPSWPAAPAAASAWLGEAIAIKDPTAAVFRKQSGSNLLIVGQREEAALAMMATSLISLAAQHGPGNARFYVLDGSPIDAPTAGYLERIGGLLPHSICNVSWRDVPGAINEIAQDLNSRQQSHHASDAPAIYLLVYGLQRFRMLRQEEDYGFSSSSDAEEAPKPEKQFGTILREGPHLGIHTLTWCDTVNNLNRALDRQGLKEFEIRVLFQMGSTDSSNLIDSPLASKLGLHRALFFSEEQGYVEKFRPYALPEEPWLAEITERIRVRDGSRARV